LVVISSFSDTLVDDDDNLTFDIFLRNIEAGTTTLISRSTFGVQADALSGEPDISAQGGHIVFVSGATNLLDNQTLSGGVAQVYLHDLQSGETSLLSTGWDGAPANGHCSSPAVSADGRYVAFASQASNLVSDDTNGGYDVFLHDTQTGATSRVSLTASGMQAVSATPSPNRSPRVALSADGRSVAFDWHTNGLVVEDTNDLWDVFVRDLQANTTQLVSTLQGGQANGRSGYPRISGDGRYVVYESEATNLHSSCIGYRGVLLFDRQTDTMECISVDFEGNAVPSILADDPDISADGRFVVFASGADNLVAVDNNDRTDIFVRDRQLSTLTMVNVTETGTQGDNSDGYPSISANGLNVAFVASSDNLVENDTNDERDILVVPAF
jgi:Tol biopolymer transport system component